MGIVFIESIKKARVTVHVQEIYKKVRLQRKLARGKTFFFCVKPYNLIRIKESYKNVNKDI